jgi:hypothetical protein
MPILFGWGKTTVKDHGECIAATCPRCHNSVVLHHIYLTVWFTLFFLPVIPYKRRRMLVCPICNWSREVPKTAVALTDEMNSITEQWRSGSITDTEYEQRVATYWAFQTSASPASSEQDQPLGPDAQP